mmetsp:Transcript_92783/g.206319  ORF Transcript_92783/g.206319 Transcript_92783/m.206319 type:complete len:298 (-) Transcript_92783:48-941(-)
MGGKESQQHDVATQPCPLSDPVFGALAFETLVPFPKDGYPFLQIVQSVLRCEGIPLGDLHNHRTPEVLEEDQESDAQDLALVREPVATCGPRDNPFGKRWQTSKLNPEASGYADFDRVYCDFLRDVVRADVGEDMILYQRIPTLRVHLAGRQPIGRPHRDGDYHHTAFEINYWVPLSDVFGTNSLWTESVRGRGDYHPLVAGYGQAVRFYGNQLWHYTVRNDTGQSRVSFDFRIVRFSDFQRAGVPVDYSRTPLSRLEHRKKGMGGQFCLGSFYGLMGPDGELHREEAEAICARSEC